MHPLEGFNFIKPSFHLSVIVVLSVVKKQVYKTHLQKNFTLAYPVMISQLGHVMVGVADSMMVGRLGATPLAAASLGNVIFHLLLTFGIGVSYGITPLVAAADGENNTQQGGLILKHGFIVNLLTGIILFLVVLGGNKILYFLNQPEEVVALAIPYLNIVTLSLIPLLFFQTFRQFAEGLSLTKQAMIVVVSANLINVGLNYIFIFGKLGLPPMGLNGAGWASLIARIIMALSMFGFVYFAKRFKVYWQYFSFRNYSGKLFNRLLKIGIPAGLQFIFEVGAFGFSAVMIGWLGAKTLAAHQIAINLASISYMAASGLSAAATIRVGNQLGRKDIPTLRTAAFTLYGMVLVFMSFCALVFFLGRNYFPTIYISDIEVISLAAPLIVIAGLFQLSDGAQVVGLGALRGLEDVKIPTVFTFIAYWVIALPLGYYLGFKLGWGANGIWIGLSVGLTLAAVVLMVRFNRMTRKLALSPKEQEPVDYQKS